MYVRNVIICDDGVNKRTDRHTDIEKDFIIEIEISIANKRYLKNKYQIKPNKNQIIY